MSRPTPNQSLHATRDGAFVSAIAGHIISPACLSWIVRRHSRHYMDMKASALIILAVILVGCGKPNHAMVSSASIPIFSEQGVHEFVTPGRTIAEITNRFGVPGAIMTNDGRVEMWFSNPVLLTNGAHPFGFSASFTNGTVEKWEVLRTTFHVIED